MNPTKALLLREMATAPDLDTYFLAYKALENLERLIAESGLRQQRVPQVPFPTAPQVGNSMPYGGFQQPGTPTGFPQAPPPQQPGPFSRSEPAWDEPQERMPWEEEGLS